MKDWQSCKAAFLDFTHKTQMTYSYQLTFNLPAS